MVGSVDEAEDGSVEGGEEAAPEERNSPTTYFTSSELTKSTLAEAGGELGETGDASKNTAHSHNVNSRLKLVRGHLPVWRLAILNRRQHTGSAHGKLPTS